jgi:hypothetical protein
MIRTGVPGGALMTSRTLKRLSVCCALAVIVFAAALSQGCGGRAASGLPSLDAGGAAGQLKAASGGFSALVLPESFVDGGRIGRLQLTSRETPHGVDVELSAYGAEQLKALLVELHYDAKRFHPETMDTQVALAPAADLLRLDMLDEPGVVYSGQVIAAYEQHPGVSGDGLFLRMRFGRGPAQPSHRVSDPPVSPLSAAQLFYTASDGLSWYFTSVGDNNQDGVVSLPDLTPLGQKFGMVSPGGAGTLFPVDDWRDLIDGSRDGAINIADLAGIGINWARHVLGYRVYSSLSMSDYPAANDAQNGPGANLVAEKLLSEATGAVGERKHFTHALPAPDPALYFWVRPYDEAGEGTPSAAKQPGELDTEPPVWIDPAHVALQDAIAKDGKVRLFWGEAQDALSPPVDYTVYYSEGDTVDFGTASTAEITDQTQVFDVTGLNNGVQYAFAVRAKDRAATPNEEQNTTTISATPQPSTDLPAAIVADMEFDGPVDIPTGQTTTVTNGAHITCLNDLVIDGTLTAYDEDINLTVYGDLTLNGHIILDGPDDPLPDGTEGHSINIVALSNMSLNDTGTISPKGNLQIVDDPADQQTPQEVINDTDNDQNPELYPFNFMPEGAGKGASRVVNVTRRTSGTQYYGPFPWRWFVSGNWGQVPTPPPGVTRIVLRVFQRNGQIQFQDFSITGPKGRKGADGSGCTAVGKPGQQGFHLRINCDHRLTFNNVTIDLCDGGDGGDAVTPACCDAVATGGNGGQPGTFRFTAGSEIRVLGTFNLNPGKGGNGGLASATGKEGDPGCPGDPGCNGTATGGNGADVSFGISVRGNVTGIGNVALGPARGGDGGDASAVGGKGGATTCPCMDGAPGGFASATGGKGGNATFTSLAGATGGGATGGNGGAAQATGGDGSDGTDCFKAPAGNGGDGGAADATGGDPGTASGNGPLTDGNQGAADATGGNGGDGGDGCPPGGGGAGGAATAVGNPANQTVGFPGFAGVENPPGCQLLLVIPMDALVPDPLVPGPIPDGFTSTAPVLRQDTMQQVGAMQFMWTDPSGSALFWYRGASAQVVLGMHNSGTDPVYLTFLLGDGMWDIDPALMTGARLGLRWSEMMGPGDIGFQQTLDAGMNVVGSAALPKVPSLPPSSPPQDADYQPTSFFDVYYRIEVEPTATVEIETICIIDP